MYYLLFGILIGYIFGLIDMFFIVKIKRINTSSELLWVFINKVSIGYMIGISKFFISNG